MSINKKLRSIDQRVAQIDRRLGFLEGRVFFKEVGAIAPIEVNIFGFSDSGITPKSLATGEELAAHRYSIKVNRNWTETYTNKSGYWFIQRSNEDPLIPCDKENEEFQDNETYATIALRVTQEISIG